MPCPELGRLLRAGEVTAALGGPVCPPTCVLLDATAGQIWRWRAASGRGSLTLTAATGPLAAQTLCVERRHGEPVTGLGDEGYLRAGQVCAVRQGDWVLKLALRNSPVCDPAATVIRLARLAAGRLG